MIDKSIIQNTSPKNKIQCSFRKLNASFINRCSIEAAKPDLFISSLFKLLTYLPSSYLINDLSLCCRKTYLCAWRLNFSSINCSTEGQPSAKKKSLTFVFDFFHYLLLLSSMQGTDESLLSCWLILDQSLYFLTVMNPVNLRTSRAFKDQLQAMFYKKELQKD